MAPLNDAIEIDFKPTFLGHNVQEPFTVARITFNGRLIN